VQTFYCPNTINAISGHQVFTVYDGSLLGCLKGGNIVFRSSNEMLKINLMASRFYPLRVAPF
jgi:hypothetical protein